MTIIEETEMNKYLTQTRSQAKSSGIKVPEIHGTNKGLNLHVKPERQRLLPSLPTYSTTHSSSTTCQQRTAYTAYCLSLGLVKEELD